MDADEDLAEIELRRGRPEQVPDRLHTMAADHPHRPRLAAALPARWRPPKSPTFRER